MAPLRSFCEEEVLSIAVEQIRREGKNALPISRLLDAMGIGAGSFYLAFQSRREFDRQALIFEVSRLSKKLFGTIADAEPPELAAAVLEDWTFCLNHSSPSGSLFICGGYANEAWARQVWCSLYQTVYERAVCRLQGAGLDLCSAGRLAATIVEKMKSAEIHASLMVR